jgi:hypothetical protein
MDPAAPSTTGTDSRSAPPSFDTRRVRAMVRRSLLSQSRNPDFWFLLLVLPPGRRSAVRVDRRGLRDRGRTGGPAGHGIMLFHLIWQLTLAGSFGLLDEVWSRNLLNLIATPLTEREMLSSFGVVGLLRTGVSVTVIGAVGVVFFAVSPTSAGVVLVPERRAPAAVRLVRRPVRGRVDAPVRRSGGGVLVGDARAADAAVGRVLPRRVAAPRSCRSSPEPSRSPTCSTR